jgi:hypothetical protein
MITTCWISWELVTLFFSFLFLVHSNMMSIAKKIKYRATPMTIGYTFSFSEISVKQIINTFVDLAFVMFTLGNCTVLVQSVPGSRLSNTNYRVHVFCILGCVHAFVGIHCIRNTTEHCCCFWQQIEGGFNDGWCISRGNHSHFLEKGLCPQYNDASLTA